MHKKILMIVTSHDRLGDTGRATGIWAEELATPYRRFRAAGHQVEIASPRGGAIPFDPASLPAAGDQPPDVAWMLADDVAKAQIMDSLRVAQVDAQAYDALFFPGGHGAMWDLADDPAVRAGVEAAYGAGKVVAAVCHGPAALVSAQDAAGRSILAGRRVSGFTDEEEAAVGLTRVVPFALESRMRALGGAFEKGANWQPHAVRDGRLITGQNPASSAPVADLVLAALGEGR